jgi:hypothetical protein
LAPTRKSKRTGTVAYDAATGTKLWAARRMVSTSGSNVGGGYSVAVSPNGSTVFVTGLLWPSGADPDMVTVAYNS